MKFSEALTEYLQHRDDERDAEHESEPIARRRDRRDRMDELLIEMDRITNGVLAAPLSTDAAVEQLRMDTLRHGHCPACRGLYPMHHTGCTHGVTVPGHQVIPPQVLPHSKDTP